MLEPEIVTVVQRNADHDWNQIVGANLREGTGGVAGRLDHKRALLLPVESCANAERLGFLERTGLELGSDLGIVSREGNVEVVQTEELAEPLAMIGDRCAGMAQGSVYRHPLCITVKPLEVVSGSEFLVFVNGADKRG